MDEVTPKKAGYCSICDALLFEVERRWTSGPLEGEVRQFGKPLPGSKRTTVVHRSGVRSDYSLCPKCELTNGNLTLAWKRGLSAMALEITPEYRELRARAVGRALKYTKEQQEANKKMLDKMANDPPLGVLFTQLWSEIING